MVEVPWGKCNGKWSIRQEEKVMPPIDKAKRRDEQRRKKRNAEFQGVRYNTLRAGESLVAFETERKTSLEGKPIKKRAKKRK
jgi:hypothetical protein